MNKYIYIYTYTIICTYTPVHIYIYICMYVHMYVYIHVQMNTCPMSHIQCGNMLIRDSPHPTPCQVRSVGVMGWGGVGGGNSSWVYFHIGYIILRIYWYVCIDNIFYQYQYQYSYSCYCLLPIRALLSTANHTFDMC